MRYKKLLVVVLSIAMVFAFAACGSNDKGSADNGDKKNVSDKLEFKGKWVKAGPLKMGFPTSSDKNVIMHFTNMSHITIQPLPGYKEVNLSNQALLWHLEHSVLPYRCAPVRIRDNVNL